MPKTISASEAKNRFGSVLGRQKAWEDLERLREQVSARNPDITTEEQALEIADQFTREAIDSFAGKLVRHFRRQRGKTLRAHPPDEEIVGAADEGEGFDRRHAARLAEKFRGRTKKSPTRGRAAPVNSGSFRPLPP